jgi:hypothetical protein
MQVIMEKRLKPSERQRHYIIIPAKCIQHFPPFESPFTIEVGNTLMHTYVDRYRRLRLGSTIFNKLGLDAPDCVVVIGKKETGILLLKKK